VRDIQEAQLRSVERFTRVQRGRRLEWMWETARVELTRSLAQISLRLAIGFVIAGASAELASAQALPDDADLTSFAVHINRTPPQSWPGYGVYLGNGLILTAEHVPGHFARTKPHVVLAGQDLPAALVKEGGFEDVDLTLLSMTQRSFRFSCKCAGCRFARRRPLPARR
jgi:hypothetical protein